MTRFVLVRGLAREAGHWHDFDAALRAHVPECTVERIDLPGNGSRWRERSPISTAEMAVALRSAVWDASDEPPVVIAISLGAMVGLDWLRRWPADPLRGLVAINTSVGGVCRAWERLQPRAMVTTLRTIGVRDPVARELEVLALTTTEHRRDRELAEVHAGFHAARPIARANVLRQMAAAVRFRAPRLSTRVPILILNSAFDRMVAPRCSAKIAAAYGATLERHPSAGHDLTLDDPNWCAEQTAAWLR